MDNMPEQERERRWHLILSDEGTPPDEQLDDSQDQLRNDLLDVLYNYKDMIAESEAKQGKDVYAGETTEPDYQFQAAIREKTFGETQARLSEFKAKWGPEDDSTPPLSIWLDDLRQFFPEPMVKIMQRDALERNGLLEILFDEQVLSNVAPDIYLVADLLAFKDSMPEQVQHAARQLVANLVEQLLNRLRIPAQQSLRGSLSRASRNLRPKRHEIDWQRTVRANLKHYQPEYKTIIPRKLIGFGRQRPSLREVFLCVDQSGSMVTSVVYASVFGAVLASLPALKTNMIFFDHDVHDVTPHVEDPVEILFSANIGGGTNINQVVGYVQQRITRPEDSICILITDLHEGGDAESLLRRVFRLVRSGVQVIVLLALTDTGTPSYHHALAEHIAAFEVPVFACTPEHFPDLMGAAINGDDIHLWAGREGFVTVRHDNPQA